MWLRDLKLVLPDGVVARGALEIVDDRIGSVVVGDPPPGVSALHAQGLTAIPGLIDLHGDMLERDIEPRPNAFFPIDLALYELDKRMASAGFTTAFAAVGFSWHKKDLRTQEIATEIIETIGAHRHDLLVEFFVHARFEINNPDTGSILEGLLARGLVQLVSLMDHTPGQGQYSDIGRYIDFMEKWLGIPRELLEGDAKTKMTARIEENFAAPRDWESAEEVCRVARRYGIPIASHDDDTHAKIDRMGAMGVTISEFPVTREAAEYARARGMSTIMGAPNAYRGSSNTGNLSARAAVEAGLVDVLATDYFTPAPLNAAYKLANEGVLPLHRAIALVSANAAAAVGLTDRGRLESGLLADIALIEEGTHPRVRAVLKRGTPIYWDSHMQRLSQLPVASLVEGDS
ncbi:MAG: alpha-D-ribose 1-methylphosphonate 5-triphosphate diphosphatase [Chloroflexota bacterium]|nr:alpha-D-ribose 1-methylphosphonate 5-triphosphate diphosphatase [Chloroflexota bacterium]